jgi:hypothetical protein
MDADYNTTSEQPLFSAEESHGEFPIQKTTLYTPE